MQAHILETEAKLVCARCCVAMSQPPVVLSEEAGLLVLPWVSFPRESLATLCLVGCYWEHSRDIIGTGPGPFLLTPKETEAQTAKTASGLFSGG